jgi:uncharacterized protein
LPEFNPEEQIDPKEPKRSFLQEISPSTYVLIVLALIFLIYQLFGGAMELLASGPGGLVGGDLDVKMSRIILIFGQFMLILAPVLFFSWLRDPDIKNTFKLKVPKASLVFLAILGIILIQPFLQGYMFLQEQAFNKIPFLNDYIKPVKDIWDMLENYVLKIVTAYSPLEFTVVVLAIAVTPAICEEFLFRGFVLSNLSLKSKAGPAIFFTGFLFAIYHFQPFNLIPLLVLGSFLGFVVYYSKSILTGIICHFLNNFFAAYYLYAYGKENFDNPQLTSSEATNALIAAIISFILFAAVMFLFYKIREMEKPAVE